MVPSVNHHYGGLGHSGLANQNILIIINQSINPFVFSDDK